MLQVDQASSWFLLAESCHLLLLKSNGSQTSGALHSIYPAAGRAKLLLAGSLRLANRQVPTFW